MISFCPALALVAKSLQLKRMLSMSTKAWNLRVQKIGEKKNTEVSSHQRQGVSLQRPCNRYQAALHHLQSLALQDQDELRPQRHQDMLAKLWGQLDLESESGESWKMEIIQVCSILIHELRSSTQWKCCLLLEIVISSWWPDCLTQYICQREITAFV